MIGKNQEVLSECTDFTSSLQNLDGWLHTAFLKGSIISLTNRVS